MLFIVLLQKMDILKCKGQNKTIDNYENVSFRTIIFFFLIYLFSGKMGPDGWEWPLTDYEANREIIFLKRTDIR